MTLRCPSFRYFFQRKRRTKKKTGRQIKVDYNAFSDTSPLLVFFFPYALIAATEFIWGHCSFPIMVLVCFGSFEPSNKNGIVKIFFTIVFKCGSGAMDSSVQVPVDRLVSMAQPAG